MITDEKLRELLGSTDICERHTASAALYCSDASERRRCRARLAEILAARTPTPAYSPKVDALLAHATNFTADDFRDLVLAALDQAGVSDHTQRQVMALVEED